MFEEVIQRAQILREALPYIRKFHGSRIVIKYGGSLMVQDEGKSIFAGDIALLKYVGINPIIVHGGGKEISKWMKRVGKDSVFIDGLRFTDSETMEITEMVLSGKINNEVVTLINQNGGSAVGLSGKDAHMFRTRKIRTKNNEDLGQVGDIDSIDVALINTLSDNGYIPVISSVGVSAEGESLNLNADTVASAVASSLQALKLIYLTDVRGIYKDGELLSHLDLPQALALSDDPAISGGMIPKLEQSIKALQNGVSNVHILDGNIKHCVLLELLTDTGIGTMIQSTSS